MLTEDTLTIQPMDVDHLPGALRLSQAENWPHRLEDWTLLFDLSKGVVAIESGEVVATALTTPFGSVATVNMIIVAKRMRGCGLGRRMMSSVMSLVAPQEWRLVATAEGQPLYEKLGFRASGEILQHQGIVEALATEAHLVAPGADGLGLATPRDGADLARLDKAASGMDRSRLMAELLRIGKVFVIRDRGEIAAFAAMRPFGRGAVAGPVVARDADQARQLLLPILAESSGRFLRVDTDAATGLAPWLSEFHLVHAGGGIAMRLGSAGEAEGPLSTFALAAQALG